MITRVQALNYRCLRHVSQRLGRFHVLVGPNASGKSTFLDAIAFLGEMLKEGPEDAVHRRAPFVKDLTWNHLSSNFELAVEMEIPEQLRGKLPTEQKFCRYEVAIAQDERTGEVLVSGETLWLRPNGSEHPTEKQRATERQRGLFPVEPRIPDFIVHAAGKHGPTNWKKIVTKVPQSGNDHFRSETSKWNSVFRLGPARAALANLPEDETRFPVAIWMRKTLLEGVQTLRLDSLRMRQPAPEWTSAAFSPDGSNLPSVVKTLGTKYPDRYSRWIDHLKTALPHFSSISVVSGPVPGMHHLELAYDTGLRVPSWLVSDGTLRMLALTLLAYVPGPGPISLIEEPENGIHPRAVEVVHQSLSSVYDAQVLVATHSPVFLGLTEPQQILCFAQAPSGATDIVEGQDHPGLRNWKGEVNLSELYAAGVLG